MLYLLRAPQEQLFWALGALEPGAACDKSVGKALGVWVERLGVYGAGKARRNLHDTLSALMSCGWGGVLVQQYPLLFAKPSAQSTLRLQPHAQLSPEGGERKGPTSSATTSLRAIH